MAYGRIGVIGAMDSELAALVKSLIKLINQFFSRFDGYDPIASGGLPPSRSPAVHLSFLNSLDF